MRIRRRLVLTLLPVCLATGGLGQSMRAAPAPTSAPPAYQLTQFPTLATKGAIYLPVGLGPDGTLIGYKDYDVVINGGLAERHTVYLLRPHGSMQVISQPPGDQIMTPRGLGYHGEIIAVDGYPGYVRVNGKWRLIGGSGAGDPMAINKQGQITGIAGSSAFLANARTGSFHVLGALPCGCAAIGRAISPSGEVVGDAEDAQGLEHAAIFPSNGGPPKLMPFAGGTKGDGGSEADAINAHGEIAGVYGTAGFSLRLFRYDGTLHDAGAIPGLPVLVIAGMDDAGRIAGTAGQGSSSNYAGRAFIEGKAGFEDLTTLAGLPKGEVIHSAMKMNAAGEILARADLGHGPVLVLLRPTRPDAGNTPSAAADFAHVAWQSTPTPVPTFGPSPTPIPPATPLPSPTAMSAPPAGILRSWECDGAWVGEAILTLHAGTGLNLVGTISEYNGTTTLTYPVTGTYTQAPAGTDSREAGGTINITWNVPTASGLIKAGKYLLESTFSADFQVGDGNFTWPDGSGGGMTLKPVATPTT